MIAFFCSSLGLPANFDRSRRVDAVAKAPPPPPFSESDGSTIWRVRCNLITAINHMVTLVIRIVRLPDKSPDPPSSDRVQGCDNKHREWHPTIT